MARLAEMDLVLPTLFLLNNATEKTLTTTELKYHLEKLLKPMGKDAKSGTVRKDSLFTQKVRNLKSHNKLEKLGYAIYNTKKLGKQSGSFTLSDEGQKYLEEKIDIVNYLLNNNFASADTLSAFSNISKSDKQTETFDENLTINEGTLTMVKTKVYKRSSKLRQHAINYYTSSEGRVKCKVCCFDFEDFYGEYGKGFIEIHHQKPVFQFDGDDTLKTIKDALENVIPVCSNCHRMIHRSRLNTLSLNEIRVFIDNAKK